MSILPAVVTILDLPLATTLSSAAMFEAVQTTAAGVPESVRVGVTQIMTTSLGALPSGGATGQLLGKSSGTDYATGWVSPSSFAAANATSGLTVAGSTSLALALASVAGLSVLGVPGTTTAIPLAITGASGGQVLRLNDAGTGVAFGAVNLASSAAVTGVLPNANMSAINLATTVAGGVQGILPVANGGQGTSTLTAFGVVYGNGTAKVGITAAGTTGWPLVGNGTAVAATFTSVLPGIGMVPPWQGGYVAGRYYNAVAGGGLGVSGLSANLAYFAPFSIGETHTFDRLAVDVATMGSATTMRVALYGVVNGNASALLVDAGTVTLATGFLSAVISQSLTAGIYFGAVVFNGTCGLNTIPSSHLTPGAYFGFGTSITTQATQLNASLTFGAFSTTAFTGTMGVASYSNGAVPLIVARA